MRSYLVVGAVRADIMYKYIYVYTKRTIGSNTRAAMATAMQQQQHQHASRLDEITERLHLARFNALLSQVRAAAAAAGCHTHKSLYTLISLDRQPASHRHSGDSALIAGTRFCKHILIYKT